MLSMKKFMRENPEEFIASILLVITTILVLMNVFFRYCLNSGIYWSEEVATSCFVWSVFIGAAGAYRTGAMLGIDLLVNRLPRAARTAVKIIVQFILLVINFYIVYLSVLYINHTHGISTSVLGVSSAWVSAAIPVGFGLAAIYTVVHIVQMFRDIRNGKEV
jgi:TRAP-type C4-dicarboxylate transport system permease small subunit